MDLPNRKTIEIRRKLGALGNELEHWKKVSEANGPFAKHHTQIRRLAAILGRLQVEIQKRIDAGPESPPASSSPIRVLAACRALERMILEVHRIWEFFRSKLVLREATRFRDYLLIADELAWACYEPALKRGQGSSSREPPLVFFNGGSNPFVISRRSSFQAEAVPGEVFNTPEFKEVLKVLPIPLVGIPWFQVEFLPELLVVAHEVGHAVEDDFSLTATLGRLLDTAMETRGVPVARRPAWRAWLGEIFADLWGCLAAGPAFAGALGDFLARDPRSVTSEQRLAPTWGSYPIDALRFLFSATVLEKTGFAPEAVALRANWTQVYADHAMPEFEADLPIVADALLEGPYPELGNGRLDAAFSFTVGQHREAETAAKQALRRQLIGARDPRVLAAAARLAFEREPENYAAGDAQERLIGAMKDPQRGGVRGKTRWRDRQETERIDTVDQHTARWLFTRLAEVGGDVPLDETPNDRAGS
ncbi:hypothetical protein [Sorangium sp. So ce861]|uniref:hypothetical protein n=1 Tax=Sorangium sp. So ce861 TaxID=3133323 RepID=UPI003F641EB1